MYCSLAIPDSTVLLGAPLLELLLCAPFLGVHSAALVAVVALALLARAFSFVHSTQVGSLNATFLLDTQGTADLVK